jgi:hypothetical protein
MINIKDLIEEQLKQTVNEDNLWQGSTNQGWKLLPTPQAKGSLGTKIYKEWLEGKGYEAKIISDQGDIKWRKDSKSPWIKDEVKAASATVKIIFKGKEKEMTTEQIWVNQIRPGQKTWRGIVIVGVYPNHTKIWRKTREDWDKNYKKLNSVQTGLKHTGQKGEDVLEQVTMIKNSNRDNFHEWECIYSDQQGEKI